MRSVVDAVRAAVADDLARLAGHRMRTLAVTVTGLRGAARPGPRPRAVGATVRALLRVLAPLLGIALAAAGVLVVIEVVAAWVLPEHEGGLLVPWPDWGATLAGLSWNQSPVPGIAIGVGVAGLLMVHRRTRRAARATCAWRRRRRT